MAVVPLPKGIPGDADARGKIVLVGLPELADAADGCRSHRFRQAVARAQNNVVLQAMDFAGSAENAVTQAEIHGEMRSDFPIVLNESGPLRPAIVTRRIGELAEGCVVGAADRGRDEVGIVVCEVELAVEFVEGIGEQAVVAIFLDAAEFETELQAVAAGDMREDVVDGERVENEMAGLENFAAHGNYAVVEKESAEIFRERGRRL